MEGRLASKPGAWQRMRPALGICFATIGLSTAAFALAAGVRAVLGATFPVSTVASLLSLGAVAALARGGRRGVSLAAGSVTLLAWVPVLLLGGLWALTAPVVTTDALCGTAELGLMVMVPLALVIAWTVVAPVATLVALAGRRLRTIMRVVAHATAAVGLLVAALAAVASRRPAPDAYLSALRTAPIAQGGQTVRGWTVTYGARAAREPIRDPDYACDVTVQRGPSSRTSAVLAGRGPCPALYAHVDDARDLLVVDDQREPPPEDFASVIASGDDVSVHDLTATGRLRGALGPPRGWTLGGLAGALLACAALFAARRVRRRAGSLQNAHDAVHAGGGWVNADGQAPRHAPELVGRPAGPVVLVARARASRSAYRDDGKLDLLRVLPGTKAEALEQAESLRFGLATFAVAAVLLTQAVLWAARLRGLM